MLPTNFPEVPFFISEVAMNELSLLYLQCYTAFLTRMLTRQQELRVWFNCKVLNLLVGVRGFEPPAPASRRQCSTRLSYTPNLRLNQVEAGAASDR